MTGAETNTILVITLTNATVEVERETNVKEITNSQLEFEEDSSH